MRISDWSSDVCSSDLRLRTVAGYPPPAQRQGLSLEPQAGLPDLPRAGVEPANQAEEATGARATRALGEIGRASCRERVWKYVLISEVAVALKKTRTRENLTKQSNKRRNKNKEK